MPKTYRAAVDFAPLLDGSSAGELIPELATRRLQQLIELEVAAVLGARAAYVVDTGQAELTAR